jgi:hypothetical protein
MKDNIPNPGSKEATEKGCLCAIIDNHYGKGVRGDGEKYGWWQTSECPLHGGEPKPPVPIREDKDETICLAM